MEFVSKEKAMHINEQKFVADEILILLEKFNPDCILVGGAPRDWYMEKPRCCAKAI